TPRRVVARPIAALFIRGIQQWDCSQSHLDSSAPRQSARKSLITLVDFVVTINATLSDSPIDISRYGGTAKNERCAEVIGFERLTYGKERCL
uniref:Uncharacterized protein n=1 Tax=Parascaris univalens TaxID=6257 RepID=A0A915B327_PARUN